MNGTRSAIPGRKRLYKIVELNDHWVVCEVLYVVNEECEALRLLAVCHSESDAERYCREHSV